MGVTVSRHITWDWQTTRHDYIHQVGLSVGDRYMVSTKSDGSDYVFFYVHRSALASQSSNAFGYLINPSANSLDSPNPQNTLFALRPMYGPEGSPPLPSISISEVSPIVNVMLHMIYGL